MRPPSHFARLSGKGLHQRVEDATADFADGRRGCLEIFEAKRTIIHRFHRRHRLVGGQAFEASRKKTSDCTDNAEGEEGGRRSPAVGCNNQAIHGEATTPDGALHIPHSLSPRSSPPSPGFGPGFRRPPQRAGQAAGAKDMRFDKFSFLR